MSEGPNSEQIQQSDAQGAVAAWVEKLYKSMSRLRYAEEREWAQAGYFDQLKQWLEEDPSGKNRLVPIGKGKSQKWPMPVTNYFSKTIATNANALGAGIPEMLALSDNYDAQNRRAAEAAENVIDAVNRECGMEVLNPTLSRRVVLWGLGITYDTISFDHSTVEVPDIAQSAQASTGLPPQPAPDAGAGPNPGAGGAIPPADGDAGQDGQPQGEVDDALQASGVQTIPTARLKTYLPTPFEVYLPRDSQDPNLSELQIVRWRKPLGEARELYPDYADKLKADTDDNSIAFFYLNTLRSLSYVNAKQNENDEEYVTFSECWTSWVKVPKDVQDKITAEWESEPSEIYEEQGFSKLQAAVEYGLFAVVWNGCVIQWAENPWDGDTPLTFFPWQKDAVSVYPKGLSVELVPLTKSLNRLDSLMIRALMSNGVVKLLQPTTQENIGNPSGDPVEVYRWDPQGDGKVKPEFFGGHAYGPEMVKMREQIVADINALGFNNSVAEGEMPGSGTAFRALAYLGSKAEETRKTQRFLWEASHELRARKILKMARKVWTEPRKIQTAGFNNRYGATELDVAEVDGSYQLNVIQDSSRPKTQTEKLQALQMLQQGGYVNPQDPSTREYVIDTLGMNDIDLGDHLQFAKAERDLEKLKQGIQPMESPFEKWDIPLKTIADYSLTEEFESLDPAKRNGILMYGQYLSEKLSIVNGSAPMPGAPPPIAPPGADPSKGGPGGQPASHVLGQVPGATVSNDQVQQAAQREAASVVPNSPSPHA